MDNATTTFPSTTAVDKPAPTTIPDSRKERAQRIIRKYTLFAGGSTLIPIDFADIVGAAAVQGLMIKELSELYDRPFWDEKVHLAAWVGIGSLATNLLADTIESFIGSDDATFNLTSIAVNTIYTAALGAFFAAHFRDGGRLSTAEIGKFLDHLIKEVQNGDIGMATFTNPVSLVQHLELI